MSKEDWLFIVYLFIVVVVLFFWIGIGGENPYKSQHWNRDLSW